jgi:hypothetical protein
MLGLPASPTANVSPLLITLHATQTLVTLFPALVAHARFALRAVEKARAVATGSLHSTLPEFPVFLLNVFAKGEKINLTMAERNVLRAVLAETAATYRKGARRHDQGRK